MKRTTVFLLLAVCAAAGAGFYLLFPTRDESPAPQPAGVEQQPVPSAAPAMPSPVIPEPSVATPTPEISTETPTLTLTPAPDSGGQEVASLPTLPQISPPLPPIRPRDPLEPEISMREFRMGSPIFIRIFKKESQLEIWAHHEGRYRLLKLYPVCTWSGMLGPKQRVGDEQAPEGFYSVTKKQLHPKSNYHRAFNLGYPNAYDQQLGRTGSALMVHGACASAGCYAMTDAGIAEIYPIVEAALKSGQKEIKVQVFPFRMTASAMKTMAQNPWYEFWKNLKEGYDRFERTREPPQAFACQGRYVLDAAQAKKQGCARIAGW